MEKKHTVLAIDSELELQQFLTNPFPSSVNDKLKFGTQNISSRVFGNVRFKGKVLETVFDEERERIKTLRPYFASKPGDKGIGKH